MKAIFIRELRENAKWAALVCVVLLGWMYYHAGNGNVLLKFGAFLIVAAPATGLVLGVAQSVFDTRPDNFAFTVHRPVARGATFAARCLAGLTLLYASLALPSVLSGWWAAQPGNQPMPFSWRVVLPLIAHLLGATLWYFAGMTVALRRAAWHGSRVLPVGLAFAGSLWMYLVSDFAVLVIGMAIAIPLGAAAAWGVFAAGGAGPRGFVARLGLGAGIFAGIVVLVTMLISIVGTLNPGWERTGYEIDRQGRLLRTFTRHTPDSQTFSVTDLAGRPLADYEGADPNSPEYRDRLLRAWATLFDDQRIGWPLSTKTSGYASMSSMVRPLNGGYRNPSDPRGWAWFNIARGVIELYDGKSWFLTGSIGPQGFVAGSGRVAERFPGTPLNALNQIKFHTLAFPSIVYWMELDERRVRPIFTAARGDEVISAGELSPPGGATYAVVVTPRRLHLIDPSGATAMSAPFDVDHDRYAELRVGIIPFSGNVVVNARPRPDGAAARAPEQVFEFAMDGRLVRRAELPWLPGLSPASTPQAALAGLITPLAGVPIYRGLRLDRVADLREGMRGNWRLYVGCMIVSGVICALVTIVLARWYGFAPMRVVAWTIANLLLGPAGVVVLLSLNERSVRERCPGCGRPRPIEEALCRRCRAPHALPESDGREIFEPADALQPAG
ncbi:MAG: hypothetical protein WBD40_23535 [Tepidisphaeraceae bacterium]